MGSFNNILGFLTGQQAQPVMGQQSPDTANISNRIQEWLGAKQPQQGGSIQDILSQRFQPTQADTYDAIIKSAPLNSPLQTGQDVADLNVMERLKGMVALKNATQIPSSVQEYQYFNQLPPAEQERFLNVKRAQQVINLGGTQMVRSPTGGVAESYSVTPKPEDMPGFKGQQARETAFGKEQGERTSTLNQMEGSLPQLEQTINKLSELGKKATYTLAGKARDAAVTQLGMPSTEGAKARTEYVNTVRDVLFPQLRATFGAQFTVREGDALISTLGDPDLPPEQKDAALRAFIDQKRQTIGSMKRELGVGNNGVLTEQGARNAIPDVFDPQNSPPAPAGGGWSIKEIK